MTTERTMDCTDIKALLSGLIDDEVDGATRHAAERHVSECPACRALLDEAERLDAGIALETKLNAEGGALPRGFEATVLANTVLADRPAAHSRLWINWTGWLAAAASLTLALTLLVLQSSGQRPGSGSTVAAGTASGNGTASGGATASAARDGSSARLAAFQPTFGFPPEQYEKVVFSPGRVTADANAMGPGAAMDAQSMLAAHDPQILYATHTALSFLMETDDTRWREDTRMVERIVAYDELLPRLDAAQEQVAQADRAVLFAARAALARAAEGLDSIRAVRSLQEIVRGLNVMRDLQEMNDRARPAASL